MGSERVDLPALRAVIAGVKDRVAMATPGPWEAVEPAGLGPSRVDHGYRIVAATTIGVAPNVYARRDNMLVNGVPQWRSEADAELIASAPTDLTTLADACERLAEENEQLRKIVPTSVERSDRWEGGWVLHTATQSVAIARLARDLTPAPAGEGEG